MIDKPIITLGSPIGIGYEIINLVKNRNNLNYKNENKDGNEIIGQSRDNSLKNEILFCVGSKSVLDFFIRFLNTDIIVEVIEKNNFYNENYIKEKINRIEKNCDIVLFDVDEKYFYIDDIFKLEKKFDGKVALDSINVAIKLVERSIFKSMVTLPVSKENINLVDRTFKGHTEYLQKKWKQDDVFMTFVSKKINVLLLTTHIPLKDVHKKITRNLLIKGILFSERLRVCLNDQRPLCLLGLNPHSGENGLIGKEEKSFYNEIVMKFKESINIEGPIPADTAFTTNNINKYSIFIANYHDQGLIPFKMVAFDSGVNLSFGMKYIRTSVDHGTAVDLIGKKIANTDSFENAYRLADVL